MSAERQRASSRRQPGTSDPPDGPTRRDGLWLKTLGGASLHRVEAGEVSEEILGAGKPLSLLLYLVFSPDGSATRDHLVDLLWANLDLDRARHALRQALWYLRQRAGRESIRSDGDELRLATPVDSDRDRFLDAVERRDHAEAVALYEGEFLPVYAAPGGAGFEQWADTERRRLRGLFLRAAETRVRALLSQGGLSEAKEVARRARDADRYDERAWRLVLEALLAAGDRVDARLEAEALERLLAEQGRPPEPSTERLLELAREPREPPPAGRDPEGTMASGRRLEPELVGREEEFAAILSAWSRAAAGRLRHVRVIGDAGLGKSRLLAEARDRLRATGARTVLVRARPGEREVSYGVAAELAAALAELEGAGQVSDGTAAILAGLDPRLTKRYAVTPVQLPADDRLRHRALALRELLEAVAAGGPVALLVDDLHWVDPASRQLLVSLLGGGDRTPVLTVTCERPAGGDGVELSRTRSLRLEPLSEEETGALLASLGRVPDELWRRGFPEALRRATGGSPLLILETLRLGLDRGWLVREEGIWTCPDPDVLAGRLEEGGAIRRRIERLPEEERGLLLLLCIAGTALSSELLAAASGRSGAAIRNGLEDLEVRGLTAPTAAGWEPTHDEIAAAACDLAGSEALRRAHAALGRVLAEAATSGRHTDGITEAQEHGAAEALRRAGRHLARAGREEDLKEAFTCWIRTARRDGDGRSLPAWARRFLGPGATEAGVRRLVSALPPSLRLRLALEAHRGWLVTGALLMLVLGAAAAAALLPVAEGPPPEAVLVVRQGKADGEKSAYRIPLRRADWPERGEIVPREDGEAVPLLAGLDTRLSLVARPGTEGWAYGKVAADSGGRDVFVWTPDGGERRFTHAPGDDEPHSWSPDGRYLVIESSRWSPNYWHDLAILDVETGRLRRLTRGPPDDRAGIWSPDGTRIAFQRLHIVTERGSVQDRSTSELCWITPDGETERCLGAGLQSPRPVAWDGSRRVLAMADGTDGRRKLVRVDLEDGSVEPVVDGLRQARVSPDGGWIAARRPGTGGAPPAWYLCPADRPDLAVPIAGSPVLEWGMIAWEDTRSGDAGLAGLEIIPPAAVPVGVPLQLRVRGVDVEGRAVPVPAPVLSWRSSDSTAARVEQESGVLRGVRAEPVVVIASAGGWRRDSARLFPEYLSPETALVEDWEGDLEGEWVPFGDPRPGLGEWPDGGRALWNRGDGYHHSGVYSRRSFSAAGGLGLEVRLSSPITAPRAQIWTVSLNAWTDPEAVEEWDHRTGALPTGRESCGLRYPAGDGFDRVGEARVPGKNLPVDSAISTGAPYTVRLQVLPDGTCGVAVNGEVVDRRGFSGSPRAPYRAVLLGKSLGTRMLAESVEVWEGVRTDIDWPPPPPGG